MASLDKSLIEDTVGQEECYGASSFHCMQEYKYDYTHNCKAKADQNSFSHLWETTDTAQAWFRTLTLKSVSSHANSGPEKPWLLTERCRFDPSHPMLQQRNDEVLRTVENGVQRAPPPA